MNERAADISRVLVASAWLDRWADITVRAIAPSQTGGSTSSTIRVITDTGVLRLKLFDDPGLVAAMPDVAAGEAHAMGCARNVLDSLVPQVVTVAPVGVEGLPPGVLMTELPGEPRTDASSIGPAVTALARLHESIPDERLPDLYPPWADLDHATVPSWATRPDCWHDLLRLISDGPRAEPNVFIHRDAQPANLLWVDDALTGIVDWTFACRGPASADLAHLRVNVVLVDGLEPATRILDHYVGCRPDHVQDPWWDAVELLAVAASPDRVLDALALSGIRLDRQSLYRRCQAFAETLTRA